MPDGVTTASHQKETKQKQATAAVQEPVAPIEQLQLVAPSVQRAVLDPGRARPADILALQRAAGNRAVSHFIQTKLTVGPAHDSYEQEADRVANQVLSMPAPARGVPGVTRPANGGHAQRQFDEEEIQTMPLASGITRLVQRTLQRQVEEEEVQTKPLGYRGSPAVQRQVEEEEVQTKPLVQRQVEEEEVQTKPLGYRGALVQRAGDGSFEAGSEVEGRLAGQKGVGQPLSDDVRSFMEPRFGADFSGVRVHTGSEAASLNKDLSAQAFTHGQDIYLDANRYEPGTDAGKRLLAHELTHTIQQTGVRAKRVQTSRGVPGVVQRWTGGVGDTGMIQGNAHLHAEPEKGRHLGTRTLSGPAYVGPRLRPGDTFECVEVPPTTPKWIKVKIQSGAAAGLVGYLSTEKGEKASALDDAVKGKLLKQGYEKERGGLRGAKALGMEAITKSEQEMLLTPEQRAEKLRGLLSGGTTTNLDLFDMVHNLLSGPPLQAVYVNLDAALGTKFGSWSYPTAAGVTVKYLQKLGQLGEATLAMRLAFNLGLVSTPRADDKFAIDVLEQLAQKDGWQGVTNGLSELTGGTSLANEATWFKGLGHYATARKDALKRQADAAQKYKTEIAPKTALVKGKVTEVTATGPDKTVADVKAGLEAAATTATAEAGAARTAAAAIGATAAQKQEAADKARLETEAKAAVTFATEFQTKRPDLTPAKITDAATTFSNTHTGQVTTATNVVKTRPAAANATVDQVKQEIRRHVADPAADPGGNFIKGKVEASRAANAGQLRAEIDALATGYKGQVNAAVDALKKYATPSRPWAQIKTYANTTLRRQGAGPSGTGSGAAAVADAVIAYIDQSPAASELTTAAESEEKRVQNEFIVASVERLAAMFQADTGALATTVEDLTKDIKTWLDSVADSAVNPLGLSQVQLRAEAVGETIGTTVPRVYTKPDDSPAVSTLKSASNRKMGLHASDVKELIGLLKQLNKAEAIKRTEQKVLQDQSWRTRSADDLADAFDEMDDKALADYLKALDTSNTHWPILVDATKPIANRHKALDALLLALDVKLRAKQFNRTAAVKEKMRSKIMGRFLFGAATSEAYQDFKALVEGSESIRHILEAAAKLDATALTQVKADAHLLGALATKLKRSTEAGYKLHKRGTNVERALAVLRLLGIGFGAASLSDALQQLGLAKGAAEGQMVYPTLAAGTTAVPLLAPAGIAAATAPDIAEAMTTKELAATQLDPRYYSNQIDIEFKTLAGKGATSIRWHRVASAIHGAQGAARHLAAMVQDGKTTAPPTYPAGSLEDKIAWFTRKVQAEVKAAPTGSANAAKWQKMQPYLQEPNAQVMNVSAWLDTISMEHAGTATGKREALITGMLENLSGEELLFEWSNIDDFYTLADEYQKAHAQEAALPGVDPKKQQLQKFLETAKHGLLNFPLSISHKRLEWLKHEFGTWSRKDRADLVTNIYNRLVEAALSDKHFQNALNFARNAGLPDITFDELQDEDFQLMAERASSAKDMANTVADRGVQFTSVVKSAKHEIRQGGKSRLVGLHRGIAKETAASQGVLTGADKASKLKQVSVAHDEFLSADERFKEMRSRAGKAAGLAIALLAAIIVAAATEGAGLPVVAAAFVGVGMAALASLAAALAKWRLSPGDVNLRDTAWELGINILIGSLSAGITAGIGQLPLVGWQTILEQFIENAPAGSIWKSTMGEVFGEALMASYKQYVSDIISGINMAAVDSARQKIEHGEFWKESTFREKFWAEAKKMGGVVVASQLKSWILSFAVGPGIESETVGEITSASTEQVVFGTMEQVAAEEAEEKEAAKSLKEAREAEEEGKGGRFVPESVKPMTRAGTAKAGFASDLKEGRLGAFTSHEDAFDRWQKRLERINNATDAVTTAEYTAIQTFPAWVTEKEFMAFKRVSNLRVHSLAEFEQQVTRVIKAQGMDKFIDDVLDAPIKVALAIDPTTGLSAAIGKWTSTLADLNSHDPARVAAIPDSVRTEVGGLTKEQLKAFRLVDHRSFDSLKAARTALAAAKTELDRAGNEKFVDDVQDASIRQGLDCNPASGPTPVTVALDRWSKALKNVNSGNLAEVAAVPAALLPAIGGLTMPQLKAFRLVDNRQYDSLIKTKEAAAPGLPSVKASLDPIAGLVEDVQVDELRTALNLTPATGLATAINTWRDRLAELNDCANPAAVPDAVRDKVGALTKEQLSAFRQVDNRQFRSLTEAKTALADAKIKLAAKPKFVDDMKVDDVRQALGITAATGLNQALLRWTTLLAQVNGKSIRASLPAQFGLLTPAQFAKFRKTNSTVFDSLNAARTALVAFKATL